MKKIILCSLLLSSLVARADDATSATNSTGTATSALTPDVKARALEIRDMLLAIYKSGAATPEAWNAADAKIDNYQKDVGVTPESTAVLVQLRQMQLAVVSKLGDQARFDALVQKLSADPQPEVAAMAANIAATQKRMAELKTKPMDLKFTAVDGSAVDLSKMQGKVVLIDFWATWCPPCRAEVPDVVAAYKKYHDQGFEIIGVSLDKDKDKMLAYTQENGMMWPQYFDGQAWNNSVSTSFGINSIPAMWLVDKKGMLVTTDGRDDLDAQVAKLLAAP